MPFQWYCSTAASIRSVRSYLSRLTRDPISAIAPWLAYCAQPVPPVRNMSGGVPAASIDCSFSSYPAVRLVTSTLAPGNFCSKPFI